MKAKALLEKYKAGTCTAEESKLIDKWLLEIHAGERSDLTAADFEQIQNEAWDHITQATEQRKAVKLWPRVAGIAAAVAAIVFGIWFFNGNRHSDPALSSRVSRDLNDIAPGGNKATIKIGDGEAITLSDKQTGVIVGDELRYSDNTLVIQSGPLSSRANGLSSRANGLSSRANAKDLTTTITTPRGGTYQITLPDGTKVWLNAASVLTYTMPLKERGGVRQVKLSGEAYFEVFRNKNQPFVVTTKNLTTTVLGTHFNISAYDDENSTKATLLEGSVKVTTLSSRANAKDLDSSYPRNDKGVSNDVGIKNVVILKPNQQALVSTGNQIEVTPANTEKAMAWKNGYFRFNNDKIVPIMSQLARWYNIEVSYEGAMPKDSFNGTVSRYKNIIQVLKALQSTKLVHFKIEGRRVIVTK